LISSMASRTDIPPRVAPRPIRQGWLELPACQLPTGNSPYTSLNANSSIMLRSVQLDSVDTEPMDACNALTAPSQGVRCGHVNGVGVTSIDVLALPPERGRSSPALAPRQRRTTAPPHTGAPGPRRAGTRQDSPHSPPPERFRHGSWMAGSGTVPGDNCERVGQRL
jgi:hypothetical protein